MGLVRRPRKSPYAAYEHACGIAGWGPITKKRRVWTHTKTSVEWVPLPDSHYIYPCDLITLEGDEKEYLTDMGAYQPIKISSVYNDGLSVHSLDKKQRNSAFLYYLLKYPRANRRIVYLESHAILTTKVLTSVGEFGPTQLIVPNPTTTPLPKSGELFTHVPVAIFEWMRDYCNQGDGPFDMGMDYCCTYEGNQLSTQPRSDIQLLFEKRLFPRENGIMWLTFSSRRHGGSHMSENVREICEMASENGYALDTLEMMRYGRGMYYIFLRSYIPSTTPSL